MIIGRFAPSPTGPLHLGSLFTAIASFLSAKAVGGQWLVRIEDTDFERCRQAHADNILRTLEGFGLLWDGSVRYQSQHVSSYDASLNTLKKYKYAYGCSCSRKSLKAYATKHNTDASVYPRLCLNLGLDFLGNNVRVQLPSKHSELNDRLQPSPSCARLSDPVIKRRNGIYNYVFTSVVDDAAQGVNQIVRGIDLLELTHTQLALAQLLKLRTGFTPTTEFAHVPTLVHPTGQKLSKQTHAPPVVLDNVPKQIKYILALLGQPDVVEDRPERMLAQAAHDWRISRLTQVKHIIRD